MILLHSGSIFIENYLKRTKAEYVSINCPESYKESPTYKPKTQDEPRLDGK